MKAGLPLLALTMALTACAPTTNAPRPAAPYPNQTVKTVPVPSAPPPVPARIDDRWIDLPATPGEWRHQTAPGFSMAIFTGPGQPDAFGLSCNSQTRGVIIQRATTARVPAAMTIRTETVTRTLDSAPTVARNTLLTASVAPADPLLDAMALSKGRFAVEVEGLPPLILPSWAEVSRVIEDCR